MTQIFSQKEQKILNYWKRNNIFQRSIENRNKKQYFVFYEGPPTANAKPGLHHILSRAYKDIICRYKTMRGFKVLRKAGWDTHGLPVELEIEKKLGLRNKKEIEKYGIDKFNKLCKQSVWDYKKEWERLTERIGFWLDMTHPYITYDTDYIETLWWILKKIHQQGLLYEDYKVVPYCWRCGTSLSSHEVAQGYKRTKELAVFVKFQIQKPKNKKNYFLVWTTTPWTLPGNVALAVNPNLNYVKIKAGKEELILAEDRLDIISKNYKILERIKGKDLVGWAYNPPFKIKKLISESSHRVYPAEFVTKEEGTGIVHIAPMYGEDDYNLAKRFNLPCYHTVTPEGKFTDDLKDNLAKKYVKDKNTEFLILAYLKKKNLIFKEEEYEHDYPFCWRCKTPLLYYAKKSWFIKITNIKKNLIKNNQKINWFPGHIKKGRFGEWLREIKDWVITRERYWGTPLPIWKCCSKEKGLCDNIVIIGSKNDLLSQKFSTNQYYILRHGHSLRQKSKLSICWPEKIHCPLTSRGEKEIKKSAKQLKQKKIDIIFSSDLLRTKQTAEIVAQETGAKIIFDERLRELNVGVFNGRDSSIAWSYLNKENMPEVKIPQGESLIDVAKRVYDLIKEINEKYQNKKILIVSHELPLTFLEKILEGWPIRKILGWRQENRTNLIQTGEWRKIVFRELPFDEKMEINFHRPYIDEIKFYCPKCKSPMKRVLEVIDCWFDSGSMPFAQCHWPFNQKTKNYSPPELFPADLICEAVDQTRGWFYTLLAISTLLGFGPAYKNAISLGHVLDKNGEKMSKSKGNVVDPWQIIDQFSADATRWYFFTINQPGEAKLFKERDIEQSLKKFIFTLWNSFVFFETYAKAQKIKVVKTSPKNILDKWIISKLNHLLIETSQRLDNYDITGAARAIESFVVEDLSQWYIRRSRKRFQKPKTKKELSEASTVLRFVLLNLSEILAPFIPFLSEEIYQSLRGSSLSVHLEDWPKENKKFINKKLEEEMDRLREITTLALSERAKAGIKIRQPLKVLKISGKKLKSNKELLELIKEEVNVKEVMVDTKMKETIELNTEITPQLREEGIIREVIRQIQEMRKRAGYKPKHQILVRYQGSPFLNKIINKNKNFIQIEAKIKKIQPGEKPKEAFDIEKEIIVDGQKLWLAIKKI